MITVSIVAPFIAGLIILLLKKESVAIRFSRNGLIALLATIISLVSAIVMQRRFFANYGDAQLREVWWTTGGTGINFSFAVDGLSQPLFLVTALLFVVAVLFSINIYQLKNQQDDKTVSPKLFWAMLMFLEGIVLGVFSAYNFVVFFIFWELFLIPLVILLWYFGLEDRKQAAFKFFIYTFVSSAFMLIAFAAIVFYTPRIGVDFDLNTTFSSQMSLIPYEKQRLLFLFFMIAFLVKMPVFPFHAWLPLTHTQAPLGSLLLSGLFLKLGSYGVLRFVTPNFAGVLTEWGQAFMILGIVSMLYGSLAAYRQKSFRLVIAYSSLAHMGLLLSGALSSQEYAVTGAIIQNVGHSLANALLFVVVTMHLARGKSDNLAEINAPNSFVYWAAFSVALFSAIGVPGTIGFAGEFLILFGLSFRSWPLTFLAVLTLVFGAAYMLRLFHKIRSRPTDETWRPTGLERSILIALSVIILWFGVYPSFMGEGARTTGKVLAAPAAGSGGKH
jgi:NADH-quinone oxidoreductase subunit M